MAHFVLSINGTNIANESNDFHQALFSATYSMCSCAKHNISISAVNLCGITGRRSPNITIEPPTPLPVLNIGCGDNSISTSRSTTAMPVYEGAHGPDTGGKFCH